MVTSTPPDASTDSSIGRRRTQARRDPTRNYIERRERLLQVATDIFAEKGLERTSINDIATRLGTDRANVYYYYSSKHEIFMALVSQAVSEIVDSAERIAASDQNAATRLEQLIEALMENYERHYPLLYLFLQEDPRRVPVEVNPNAAELNDLSGRYRSAVSRITEEGVQSGEFRSDLDIQMTMFAITGAVNWTYRWFVPGGRLTSVDIGRNFASVFLRGIKAPRRRKPAP